MTLAPAMQPAFAVAVPSGPDGSVDVVGVDVAVVVDTSVDVVDAGAEVVVDVGGTVVVVVVVVGSLGGGSVDGGAPAVAPALTAMVNATATDATRVLVPLTSDLLGRILPPQPNQSHSVAGGQGRSARSG